MKTKISFADATSRLNYYLKGAVIQRIVFDHAGWELHLNKTSSDTLIIGAGEIFHATKINTITNAKSEKETSSTLFRSQYNVVKNDAKVSTNIFNLINKSTLESAQVDADNNLLLQFKEGTLLYIPALVDATDWAWHIEKAHKLPLLECNWGELYQNKQLCNGLG